jgi:hypothetical protein
VAAACLLLAVASGGCGSPLTPAQKGAIGKIQDLGGKINFEGGGYNVDLSGVLIEDADLAYLKDVPGLREVDLRGTRISDDGLKHLHGIETMTIVKIERTTVSPQGAEQLQQALPDLDVRY